MGDLENSGAAPRKTLSKKQAVAVMVSGGLLFALSLLLPAEPGTGLYLARLGIGTAGVIVVCVGAYLRPMPPVKTQ